MAFLARPHPNPEAQVAHLPCRVYGAERKAQAALDFIEEIILSNMDYSFMDNLLFMAEQATKDRACRHTPDEAMTGTDKCAICLQNHVSDFGIEIWSWFKSEYNYLFNDSRGRKDTIRDLKSQIANLEQTITQQADRIADLEVALAVARGCTTMTQEEEHNWRIHNDQGHVVSIWHKNKEVSAALSRMEKSRDWYKKAHKEALLVSNNAYSELKVAQNALNALRGDHGPLLNGFINLISEVEMLSTAVGALTLKREQDEISAAGQGDVIVTHTVGVDGTLDRYLVEPSRRDGMRIIRTEKYAVGSGETHVMVRGSYGNHKNPWGETPLFSKHMISSHQEMESLKGTLNSMAQLIAQAPHSLATPPTPPTPPTSSTSRASGTSKSRLPNWPKRPRIPSVVVVPPTSTANRAPRTPVRAPPPRPFRPPLPPGNPAPLPPLPPSSNPRPRAPLPSAEAGTIRGNSSEIVIPENVMVE